MKNSKILVRGMRDGIPIGLGYYAVAFSLGIIAKKAGIPAILGFFSSLFTRASAGEYGGYTLMAAGGTYIEIVIMSLVTNLRYLLMGMALSQKFSPQTGFIKRLLTGCCITDEIFGISIAYEGYLSPLYPLGATLIAAPMWALGTFSGIVAGEILPPNIVTALGVALYGMFIAIVVPPAKKDKAVMCAVIVSFAFSYLCAVLPVLSAFSSGTRTILLTIVISAFAAWIKPVDDENK